MKHTNRALLTGVLVLAFAASACGSSSDDKKSDSSSSTTTTAIRGAVSDPVFEERGPYESGVLTLQLGDRKTEVWYPVNAGDKKGAPEKYSIADWLPESVTSRISADQRPLFQTRAYRDAPAAKGKFPLVLFSHGVLSYRDQSSFLTDHLASWGMVVMSTDHLERGIATIFDPNASPKTSDDVTDLKNTLELGLQENARKGSPLEGRIDPEKIGAVGHSAGGGAVLRFGAQDPRVKVVVSLTTPLRDPAAWPAGKPVMFIAGTADQIIASDTVVQGYDQLQNAPKRLVLIDGAGHLAFSDICEIGKERGGILQIAAANGLSLDERVLRLGSDGCNPPDLPSTDAWPVIRNFTTGELRYVLGLNKEPYGLGEGVQTKFDNVKVEYRFAG